MAPLLLKWSQVPQASIAGKDRGKNNRATLSTGKVLREITLSSTSLQTLGQGGEGSLSGPQQHVAVQRPALPLQEGRTKHKLCAQFILPCLSPAKPSIIFPVTLYPKQYYLVHNKSFFHFPYYYFLSHTPRQTLIFYLLSRCHRQPSMAFG